MVAAAFICMSDFDGFERMAESDESTVEISIPVALNSDVALECEVLDAKLKPSPRIKWYDDQGEIQEIRQSNSVRFLDDGHLFTSTCEGYKLHILSGSITAVLPTPT